VSLHQGMESWARFLIAAGLIVWLGATSTVAMTGYAVAIILVLGSQYTYFRRIALRHGAGTDKDKSWQWRIWKYSWPFATWGICSWAQQASDRWALGLFATTQEVGLYAVLCQFGYYPMAMVTGMVMQFFGPIFFHRAGDANDSRRNASVNSLSWRLTGLVLSVTGAVVLVALQFHAQIFLILVAKEYWSVSHLLPWMLVAGGVFAAGQIVALNPMSQMRTHTMVAATIIPCLLGVAFNFAGAYWYGTTGVVIAGILFSVLYFVWMTTVSTRTTIASRISYLRSLMQVKSRFQK